MVEAKQVTPRARKQEVLSLIWPVVVCWMDERGL